MDALFHEEIYLLKLYAPYFTIKQLWAAYNAINNSIKQLKG